MKVSPQVTLISHTPDPIRSLYQAYRVCYSALTPQQVLERIEDERIPREKMVAFVEERLKTGHVSPLEQVVFEFGISGVSRAFSHQFVRHRVGISFEQQSQRYVTYARRSLPYVMPKSITEVGMEQEVTDLYARIQEVYDTLVENGVDEEDARFLLPNATATNFKININFAALLHMADLRLCTRAQWEFRKVVSLMRSEVMKVEPILGRMLGPKCFANRKGYCDEDIAAYEACPLSAVRPHKEALLKPWNGKGNGDVVL